MRAGVRVICSACILACRHVNIKKPRASYTYHGNFVFDSPYFQARLCSCSPDTPQVFALSLLVCFQILRRGPGLACSQVARTCACNSQGSIQNAKHSQEFRVLRTLICHPLGASGVKQGFCSKTQPLSCRPRLQCRLLFILVCRGSNQLSALYQNAEAVQSYHILSSIAALKL